MKKISAAVGLGIILIPSMALANPLTVSLSSSGSGAEAIFDVVAGNLQITLTNTGTATNNSNPATNALLALFFNASGVGALTPVSAVLGASSSMLQDMSPATNPANWWAYSGSITPTYGASRVLQGAGYGIGGPSNANFPNRNVPPDYKQLNGVDGAIVPTNYSTGEGNGVFGTAPVIRNQVIFTLSGIPINFNPSTQINTVSFQWGTALGTQEVCLGRCTPQEQVPEPSTLLLLCTGVGLVGVARRKSIANLLKK